MSIACRGVATLWSMCTSHSPRSDVAQVNLSFPVLHALSDRCQALRSLVLSDLAMPRKIARATVTSVKGLEFPALQSLSITRCPLLAEVSCLRPFPRLPAPQKCVRVE
jgi:hypothetical protein